MRARMQNSHQKEGRIDGGQLALPRAVAAIHVLKVVVKAMFVRKTAGDEFQSGLYAALRFRRWHEAISVGDTERAQPEACSGDAADAVLIHGTVISAVFYQPRDRRCRFN